MERRNSSKRYHDEKYVQDDRFKRQKSISDDLNMHKLFVDDEQPPPLPEEEGVGHQQQLVKEEDIFPTHCETDFGACRFMETIGEKVIALFNKLPRHLPVHIHQKPAKIKDDGGAALHMMDSSGNPVPLGMQLRRSNEGFDVCHVNDRSIIKDKLRVGDKIIKVSGLEKADMNIEDVQKHFMRNKSVEITIKRSIQLGEDYTDGKNDLHTFVLRCTLSFQDDAVEVSDVNFETCGKYQLLLQKNLSQTMCVFRNDYTNGKERFLRCKNAAVEAGHFDQTMSSFEVHKFVNLKDTTKQVWILKNENMKNKNKFITACSDKSHVKLTDGQEGPLLSCDGRAFTYLKYSHTPDSIALESLEHPKHYLAIDGNEVKLLNVNNFPDGDEHNLCKLEVKVVHTSQM